MNRKIWPKIYLNFYFQLVKKKKHECQKILIALFNKMLEIIQAQD